MKKVLIAGGLLLFQPLLLLAENINISVGTTSLSIPIPEGYSLVTSDLQPEFTKLFVPPINQQFALFVSDADAAVAARGEVPPRPQRWFSVQSAKAVVNAFATTADFAQIKRTKETQNEEILRKALSQMPGLLQKLKPGISEDTNVDLKRSFDGMLPLPPHHETERCLVYPTLLKYPVNDEEGRPSVYEGVVTASMVHVRGKVLFLRVNAEQSGLDWCKSESRKWADTVIAANPSVGEIAARERGASTKGFALDKALVEPIALSIGGIVAGLVMYLERRRAKKRLGTTSSIPSVQPTCPRAP